MSRQQKNSYSRFAWMWGILLLLIFVRYALQINIPRIAFLVLIALIASLGSQTEIIAICVCLIPLHESVDFYYALLICIAIYVMKNFRRMKMNAAAILVLMPIVWELLHCFNPDTSLLDLMILILPLASLFILFSSDLSKLDYFFIIRVMAVTTLFCCITMFGQVLYWSDFNLAKALLQLRRLGVVTEAAEESIEITGGTIQTNSLGIICVLVVTGLLQIWSVKESSRTDILLTLGLLLFGALTSSRTFLVCLAVMVVLLILGQEGGLRQKIQLLGVLAAVIAAVLFLLNLFLPALLEYYVGRFSESDISTGRGDLMTNYHRFIVENPRVMFFGIGLQNFGGKLIEIYRVANNTPHNSIQEIILAWGLPGLLLFAVLIFLIIRMSRKYVYRHTLLNYIPLIILLLKSMAGQLLTSGYSMLTFSYAYLSLCQAFRLKEEK